MHVVLCHKAHYSIPSLIKVTFSTSNSLSLLNALSVVASVEPSTSLPLTGFTDTEFLSKTQVLMLNCRMF